MRREPAGHGLAKFYGPCACGAELPVTWIVRVCAACRERLGMAPPASLRAPKSQTRGRCPGCGRYNHLTRHHLAPLAAGGKNGAPNILWICASCHREVHRRFGPGDAYSGPTTAEELLAAIAI